MFYTCGPNEAMVVSGEAMTCSGSVNDIKENKPLYILVDVIISTHFKAVKQTEQ